MKKKEDIAKIKKEIKDSFFSMSDEDQAELLKELSTVSGTAITIHEFAAKHQQICSQSIKFSPVEQSGLSHNPIIKITVLTAFGDFTAEGSNQKIAKANACAMAEAEAPWNNPRLH
jgi:hypothetical protein